MKKRSGIMRKSCSTLKMKGSRMRKCECHRLFTRAGTPPDLSIIYDDRCFDRCFDRCLYKVRILCPRYNAGHHVCIHGSISVIHKCVCFILRHGYMRHKTTALCVWTNNPGLSDACVSLISLYFVSFVFSLFSFVFSLFHPLCISFVVSAFPYRSPYDSLCLYLSLTVSSCLYVSPLELLSTNIPNFFKFSKNSFPLSIFYADFHIFF